MDRAASGSKTTGASHEGTFFAPSFASVRRAASWPTFPAGSSSDRWRRAVQ
jgi:hypothetical protein